MNVAASLLRQARLASGLSGRTLARLAGTPQSRVSEIERDVHDPSVGTLDKAIRAVGWQLAVLPSRAPTAAAVALAIRRDIESPDQAAREEQAFRTLLSLADGLRDAASAVRVALCVAPPASTGDNRFDAAIAAVVEHLLSLDALPVPEWVHEPARTLEVPWTPDPYAGPDVADEVPAAFFSHGVLLAARELESA